MPQAAAIVYVNGKPQTFWDALALEIGATPRPAGTVDPTGLGYAAFIPLRQDDLIAQVLNFVPDGVTAYPVGTGGVKPTIAINDGTITALEWTLALNATEVAALTAGQAAYVDAISQYVNRYGSFTYTGRLQTQINTIFPAVTAGRTQTQLNLKATKSGSRAEQILVPIDRQWIGYQITTNDVSFVLNGQIGG